MAVNVDMVVPAKASASFHAVPSTGQNARIVVMSVPAGTWHGLCGTGAATSARAPRTRRRGTRRAPPTGPGRKPTLMGRTLSSRGGRT